MDAGMIVAGGSLLAVSIGLVAAFTVAGRAILVLADTEDRPLSAATLVGAGATVLWLCAASLVVPPGSVAGVGSLLLGAAALVGLARVRRRARVLPAASDVGTFAGALLAAAVAAAPFVVIVATARSTAFVHLGGNHDGFFFTAAPRWLMDHRAVGSPGLTTESTGGVPLLGSVWDRYQGMSLRYGTEALVAAVARITRSDPVNVWLPVTATFHALLAVAVQRVATALGRGGWFAVAAAATVATSTLAVLAVLEQHTPAILAGALVLGLLAEVDRSSIAGRSPTPPIVLAVMATAVVAAYGEILVLVAPAMIVLIATRAVHSRRGRPRVWAQAVAWSAVLGAPIWWRAVRGVTRSNSPDGYVSPFDAGTAPFAAARNLLIGPIDRSASWASASIPARLAVVAVLAAVAAGLLAVLVRGRARPWWAALVVTTVAGWWWFGHRVASGYPQTRWIEWATPILLLGALLGWLVLADRLAESRVGSRRRASALLAGAMLMLAAPGLLSLARVDDAPNRRVDASFTEMAAWVQDRDPTGADTVVWSADYFTNLWGPYVLRGAPDTAYLSIYRDYYDIRSYGELSGRRWLVLDSTARRAAQLSPGAEVAANDRFALVDLRAGPAVLTVAPRFDGRWSAAGLTVTVTLDPTTAACTADDIVVACP